MHPVRRWAHHQAAVVSPASDEVDAALQLSCDHIAPCDQLRGPEPSRREASRVLGLRNLVELAVFIPRRWPLACQGAKR